MKTTIELLDQSPTLRVELTTMKDSQGSVTHSLFSQYPEQWLFVVEALRDALRMAAEDMAKQERLR